MTFLHISDLHLGKRLNEFSLIEDQRYILVKILNLIDETKPDALLIAGDIYDKGIPSVEAVTLFDDFLCRLATKKIQVFIISGNHDSPERMTCGTKLMEASGIHFAPVYDGNITPYKMKDKFGEVNIYLLPFIKPAIVKSIFPELADEILSYTDAVKIAIQKMNVNPNERNVLVAHQFVTGSARCDSEDISVGGSDNVDICVFNDFDYVALGHLHGNQTAGKNEIRYSGSPLKYSFSEVTHCKGALLITMENKSVINITQKKLEPLRDLRELKGSYAELTLKKNYENTNKDDFLHITLTDEDDILEGFSKLQVIYKNLIKLDYDNERTRTNNEINGAIEVEKVQPIELFSQFFELQNNVELSEQQRLFTSQIIENIWAGGEN